jgi:hypothetical protein
VGRDFDIFAVGVVSLGHILRACAWPCVLYIVILLVCTDLLLHCYYSILLLI